MSQSFDPSLKEVSLGTTILAASFNGGVILAADTRTSSGSYVGNRATDKITPLSENVYICRSGSAAATQAIASYVQYFIAQHQAEKGDQVDVKTAANLAMSLLYSNKELMEAGMIIAGWDKDEGGTIYALPLGGTLLKVPFTTGGSGSTYIFGYCDKHYRQNMTEEECKNFVTKAVSYAIARDASSGGCIRMVTITERGASRVFIPGQDVPTTYGAVRNPLMQATA